MCLKQWTSSFLSFEFIKLKDICPKMFFFLALKNNAHIKTFHGIVLKLETSVWWHQYRPHLFKSVMLLYFPLTFELWRMKESRSTELISSKSSTPSVSPDREERFSQFPEDTSRCYQSEQEATTTWEKPHQYESAGKSSCMWTVGLGGGSIPPCLYSF